MTVEDSDLLRLGEPRSGDENCRYAFCVFESVFIGAHLWLKSVEG